MSWLQSITWRRAAFGLCLLVAGLGVFAYARSGGEVHGQAKQEQPQAAPAVFVTVAPVSQSTVVRHISVVGDLYGYEEIVVSAKVDGRILRVAHEVGDIVRPGDVLAELDDVEHRLAAEESRRAIELECARLGLAKPPEEMEQEFDVTQLPAVVKAAASERFAALQVARADKLAERNAISREERERIASERDVAAAAYQQTLLDARTTLAQLRHRQATLAILLDRLREARVVVPEPSRLPPGEKRAEFVVTERMAREGEFLRGAGSQSGLFKLALDRTLKLRAAVPERHRAEVAVGQNAEIEIESRPGEKLAGVVGRVSPAIDRASRTFEVEIHVPNADRRLAPGSFAKAQIVTRANDAVLTVPEQALVTFEGLSKVYIVEGKVVREAAVKAGQPKPGVAGEVQVEVTGPLAAGQLLVTSGHAKLSDGAEVRVRETRTAHGQDGTKR